MWPKVSFALVVAVLSISAWACGHCEEDLVAAVYDHALQMRTRQLKQNIMYMAWDGPVTRDASTGRKLALLAAGVPGVTSGSVRVSVEPAAISIAFDPVKTNRAKIEFILQEKFSKMNVMVLPLPERR